MNFSINFECNSEIASSRTAIAAVVLLMELAGSVRGERARQKDTRSGPCNRRYRNVNREHRGTTAATAASAQVFFD